jgi:radical SAM/Cys-rich protein
MRNTATKDKMTNLPLVTNHFTPMLQKHELSLLHGRTEVLQINVGKKCNQTCAHCHVNAGPARTEIMTRDTIDRIVDWLALTDIGTVDITGGAPELNPHFRYLVERVKVLSPSRHVIDRCNLTILFEPAQEHLAEFLAAHQVEIVASLPCYSSDNVNAQRGDGVFDKSIAGLQKLNELGYGRDERLPLNLVYNPLGAHLPGPQAELEADYRRELQTHFGITFNHLYTITNLPISRFAALLQRNGQLEEYQQLLVDSFNPSSVAGLMCRNTLNIGWRGEVYDCDFNQMLGMQWRNGRPLYLWDIDPQHVEDRPVLTGNHCFGCTAGAGSSCGGAILQVEDSIR